MSTQLIPLSRKRQTMKPSKFPILLHWKLANVMSVEKKSERRKVSLVMEHASVIGALMNGALWRSHQRITLMRTMRRLIRWPKKQKKKTYGKNFTRLYFPIYKHPKRSISRYLAVITTTLNMVSQNQFAIYQTNCQVA